MSTDNRKSVEIDITAMQNYLSSIGFASLAGVGKPQAFRHLESGTMILLTQSKDSELVRPADFLSIKFRLASEGLISADAIAELNEGRLPIAS